MSWPLLRLPSLVAVIGLLLAAAPLRAEPVATIENNGPSANRIDIVFLGDGYTNAQLGKYGLDVATFADRFFGESPFSHYRPYFNLQRVDVVSAESGADHPSTNVYRDTALGAFYDCSGITRLICVDWSAVSDVLSRSVSFDQQDIVIIIVNDPQYGGSGGAFAVSSVHPDGYDVVLHEVGHSFGLLADEYDYSPPSCRNSTEPIEPNVTIETNRARIKWRHWIEATTPVPTPTFNSGEPGLYPGGRYCPAGMYRPTYNSKMRNLFQPFEQINVEQLVKRMYNFVSPIDDYVPAQSLITTRGVVAFSVETVAPAGHTLSVRWELDGTLLSTATGVSVDTRTLSDGDHTLHALVRDPTPFVRNDPDQLLLDVQTWTIRVANGATTTLPSGWTSADVGSVGRAGSAGESGGTFTVSGAGADVWGTSDQFHFVYRPLSSDGTIVARVASITGSQPWAKIGVMIRASASPSSQHAFMLVSLGKGLAFQHRPVAGGISLNTPGPAGAAPRWVRLQRLGHVFTASASDDGVTWTTVGRETIVMPATALAGLAVSSHTSSALATATFDQVSVTAGAASMPPGWSDRDIGAVGLAGSAGERDGMFTVKGAGADVWGTADALHFAYRSRTGDGTIVVRVATISGSEPWTKVGAMIRASTSPDAQHAFALVSAGRNLAFQRRVTAGGGSTHTAGPAGTAPRWVRLQRAGNAFTASASSDGATWTVIGRQMIAMPATALWGLAVSSHTTSTLATATFANVSISP